MGIITVFSLEGCGHCKRAKALLDAKGWEFTEISLTSYPEKRADMIKVADKMTVPQVFFNNKLLGGAAELQELADNGGLETEFSALDVALGPTLPELKPPAYPPMKPAIPSAREVETICVNSILYEYQDIVNFLKSGLNISDKRYYGVQLYKNVFTGTEFVDYILREARFGVTSRQKAVDLGRQLLSVGVFHHVKNEHDLEDDSFFYRLQMHAEPKMLNKDRLWADRVDDPLVTVKACKKLLDEIQTAHTDSNGMVDYVAMGEDVRYAQFNEAVCEFQKVNMATMEQNARIAFVINIYNMAIIHAYVQVGIPQTTMQRYSFFDHIGYCIGGSNFSFNDLENGVLRGNKTAPAHLRRPFGSNDPRSAISLPEVERRVHFALNCGAQSCPPIKSFSAEAVNEELSVAASAFFEMSENCKFNVEERVLSLSKILAWYASDFGPNPVEIASVICEYLRGDNKKLLESWVTKSRFNGVATFKIKYLNYNWGTNASQAKGYSSSNQKVTSCSLC